jgi:dethiobiotin synthetase
MGIGIFLTGTDTAVGKTLVAGALAKNLCRRGLSVGVMKPVETGVSDHASEHTDTNRLVTAAAVQDDLRLVNPFSFPQLTAPSAAARLSSQIIALANITRCYRTIAGRHHITLVEGIGGLLVPVGDAWDVRDLIIELGLPVIVVGRTALGGINHARLTMEALRARHIRILALVLNQTRPISSDLEREQDKTTCSALRELITEPVLGPVPYLDMADHDWQRTVDCLALDPLFNALGDLVSRIEP